MFKQGEHRKPLLPRSLSGNIFWMSVTDDSETLTFESFSELLSSI